MVSLGYLKELASSVRPFRTYSYGETYSSVEQLAGDSPRVYVNQGKADLTSDGRWLTTEGLKECAPIILKKIGSLESLLIHLTGFRLFPQQVQTIEKMSPGQYYAFGVVSKISIASLSGLATPDSGFLPILKTHGIEPIILGDIPLEHVNSSFGVAFDPAGSLLKTISPRSLQVDEFHIPW